MNNLFTSYSLLNKLFFLTFITFCWTTFSSLPPPHSRLCHRATTSHHLVCPLYLYYILGFRPLQWSHRNNVRDRDVAHDTSPGTWRRMSQVLYTVQVSSTGPCGLVTRTRTALGPDQSWSCSHQWPVQCMVCIFTDRAESKKMYLLPLGSVQFLDASVYLLHFPKIWTLDLLLFGTETLFSSIRYAAPLAHNRSIQGVQKL